MTGYEIFGLIYFTILYFIFGVGFVKLFMTRVKWVRRRTVLILSFLFWPLSIFAVIIFLAYFPFEVMYKLLKEE